jgi:hypothetical protein
MPHQSARRFSSSTNSHAAIAKAMSDVMLISPNWVISDHAIIDEAHRLAECWVIDNGVLLSEARGFYAFGSL